MSKQQLLDYLNEELTAYDNAITEQQNKKVNLDQAIDQQKQNIDSLEQQKAQCDVSIANFEEDKVFVNEIIVIVEAS
jgi:chromosome segregation ATPase